MNQLEIYKRLVGQAAHMKYMAELNDVEGDKQGRAANIAFTHAQIAFAQLAREVLEGGVEVDTDN